MKSTPSKRSESIRRKLRKKRSSVERMRWTKRRINSTTTTINRSLSAIPVPRRTQIALRPGLTVFHGGLNQSSGIQQIRFGKSRTDQLQTGQRNGLVGDRNRDGQRGNT